MKRGLVFHGMGFDKGKRFRANRGERWMIRGAVYQNGAGQGRYRLLCAVCDMTGQVTRRLAPRCPAVYPTPFVIPADAGIQGGWCGWPAVLRSVLPCSSFLRTQESRGGGAVGPSSCGLSCRVRHSCGRRNPGGRGWCGWPAVLRSVLPCSSFLRTQESRGWFDHPAACHSSRFHGNDGPGCVGAPGTRKARCRPCRHNDMARGRANQAEACRLWLLARKHFQRLSRQIKPHK